MMLLSSVFMMEGVVATEYINATFEADNDGFTVTGAGRSTDTAYQGSYSMKASGQTQFFYQAAALGTSGAYYVDLWVYPVLSSYNAGTKGIYLFCPSTGAGYGGAEVYVAGTDIYYMDSGSTISDTGLNLNDQEWNRVQMNVTSDHYHYQIKINNGTAYSFTGENPVQSITNIYFGDTSSGGDYGTNYYDNIRVSDDSSLWESGESSLQWFTTSPLLTAINNTAYYYDSDVGGATGYNMTTNATGLSIDSSGNVTGTLTAGNATYWVNVTADNGTAEVSQNYTLRVYDGDIFFTAHGNDIPSSTFYWEAGIRYGYDFYVPYLIDGAAQGEVAVAKYDGANDTWSYSGSICNNPTDDGHAGTILIRTSDGKLHIFYGCHESYVYHRVSTYANDISSWSSATAITGNDATYAQPWINPDNGTVYLFYRKTIASASNYQWAYRISIDDCVSWGSEKIFHTYTSGYATYLWLSEPTEISDHWLIPMTWSIHNYGSGVRENVYYAYFNVSDSHCYNVTRSDLGVTIDQTETDNNCIIVDTGTEEVYSEQGVLINETYTYMIYPRQDVSQYNYYFIYYNGSGWSTPLNMGNTDSKYSHCTMFLYDDTIHYYALLNRSIGSRSEVQYWTYNTTDDIWTKHGTVLDSSLLSSNANFIGITGPIWNTTSRSIVITEETNTGNPIRVYVYGVYGFLVNGTHLYDYEPPEEPENDAPTVSSPNPTNGRTGVDITLASWSCTIADPDEDTFNWSIEISNGDSNSANDESDGAKSCTITGDLAYHTTYYIWVNVTDGEDFANYTFSFTTEYDPSTVESLPMHDMTWTLWALLLVVIMVGLCYKWGREIL